MAIDNIELAEDPNSPEGSVLKQLPNLPIFDIEVERVAATGTGSLEGINFQDDIFTVSDGTIRRVRIFEPPEDTYDYGVTFTSPLFTKAPGGLNDMVGALSAKRGNVTILVGPPEAPLIKTMGILSEVTTAAVTQTSYDGPASPVQDAFVHHLVLDQIDQDGRYKEGTIIGTGYSRGAMIGLVMEAYSCYFSREMVFGSYTDPCCEHNVLGDDNRLKHIGAYTLSEITELKNGLSSYSLQELRRLGDTVPRTPQGMLMQAAIGINLLRGQTGPPAENIPQDALMIVRFFQGSAYNHTDSWIEMLESRARLGFLFDDGAHLRGIDKSVVELDTKAIEIFQQLVTQKAISEIVPGDITDLLLG